MDRRFELRKAELFADCQVHPAVFTGMMERLDQFAEPFAARLRREGTLGKLRLGPIRKALQQSTA